ncbi:MAG TPA: aminodeoxychorismate lyase [Arenicellales bacterium]|nr:aminodeoxychorismate lyase [Arenicellales bacterium]
MLIEGQPGDCIPALDRGLQFGDGLFETIAVRAGHPLLLNDHLARLRAGAQRLHIDPPVSDDELGREIAAQAGDLERGIVKLIVTRGAGGRGYAPPADPSATRIVSAHRWPDGVLEKQRVGVRVGLSPLRLGAQPVLAGIKHLNRLEQVLARTRMPREWDEALMRDHADNLVEATAANLFLVMDDRICTPPLAECGVAGVIRGRLLDGSLATSGLPVFEQPLAEDDLRRAREVFLTNCVIGLWPVTRVDDCGYAIGPISRALQTQLHEKNLAILD